MRDKAFVLVLVLLMIAPISDGAGNETGLNSEIYAKLSGVWDIKKEINATKWPDAECSWGKAKAWSNDSLIIDLGDEYSNFFTGPMGGVYITNIQKKGNDYVMRIEFRDKNEYNLDISVLSDGAIVFHEMKWWEDVFSDGKLLTYYGKDHPYYRIDSPQILYLKPTIPKLRLRERPWTGSTVQRILDKDERLLILIHGKKEVELEKVRGDRKLVKVQIGGVTIDGVKGNWVKVLTEKDEIGWCFDAYLEPVAAATSQGS